VNSILNVLFPKNTYLYLNSLPDFNTGSLIKIVIIMIIHKLAYLSVALTMLLAVIAHYFDRDFFRPIPLAQFNEIFYQKKKSNALSKEFEVDVLFYDCF